MAWKAATAALILASTILAACVHGEGHRGEAKMACAHGKSADKAEGQPKEMGCGMMAKAKKTAPSEDQAPAEHQH